MIGIDKLVWNFAKAVVEHAKDGFKKVSTQQYRQRMTICTTCPDYLPSDRCRLCGCHMPTKAGWKSSRCAATPPKWEKINAEGKERADTADSD